jgi:hypothetical protein
MRRPYTLVVILLLVIIAIAAMIARRTKQPPRRTSYPQPSGLSQTTTIQARIGPPDIYPNPILTPGKINSGISQENIAGNICNPNWSTKSIRPPERYTNRLKRRQIQEYGFSDTNPKDYEEDHLIPLELGGSPIDPGNLWPEPYHPSIPNGGARFKDEVENYLHRQVCTGEITLAQAQEAAARDWYAVYLQMRNH